jgi:tetratricopeptide (TPR) repeat protein
LQRALDLLKANQIAEAEALFQVVADDKASRIMQDKKDAAAAFRNLGVIAGLRDPRKALDAYERALEYDPDDLNGLMWAGYLLIARGNLDAAQTRLDRLLSLASEGQSFHRFWAQLFLGDIRVRRGDLAGALKSFRDGLAIAERLAQANPGKAGWQRDLSVSYNKIGDVLVAQGNLAEALQSFRASHDIFDRLAQSDPGNTGWQRDLSVSYNKIGDVLKAQGNLPEALKSFRGGLAIRERLAQADPSNAGWQRDLSASYERVGDVLVAQGNLPEALKWFRDGLAIRDRLAQSDPGNAGWQHDLSVSYNMIGDVLVDQGNLPEALKSFRDGLAIRDRLAQADPSNAGWRFDLVVSHWKLAVNGDDAPGRFAFIVATLRKLKEENRLTPTQERWLPEAEPQLAKTR